MPEISGDLFAGVTELKLWNHSHSANFIYVRFGSLADICNVKSHVCFTPKADIRSANRNVRFGPKADIRSLFDHLVGVGEQRDKLNPSAFAVRIYSRAVFAMP